MYRTRKTHKGTDRKKDKRHNRYTNIKHADGLKKITRRMDGHAIMLKIKTRSDRKMVGQKKKFKRMDLQKEGKINVHMDGQMNIPVCR